MIYLEKSNMQKVDNPNLDKSVPVYNLDVIISVGYRVKSKQGSPIEIGATNVLRDYLLKEYALNQRIDRVENTSLKDLGKKYVVSVAEPWFAFSKMDTEAINMLKKLNAEKYE